jgi:hypothetical protein
MLLPSSTLQCRFRISVGFMKVVYIITKAIPGPSHFNFEDLGSTLLLNVGVTALRFIFHGHPYYRTVNHVHHI